MAPPNGSGRLLFSLAGAGALVALCCGSGGLAARVRRLDDTKLEELAGLKGGVAATRAMQTRAPLAPAQEDGQSQETRCVSVHVGPGGPQPKQVSLPDANMQCSNMPDNDQLFVWQDTFRTTVQGSSLTVERVDIVGASWGQDLWLRCCKAGPVSKDLQELSTRSATAVSNPTAASNVLRSVVQERDGIALTRMDVPTDVDLAKALGTACTFVDEDQLNALEQRRLNAFVYTNLERFEKIDRNLKPWPCLVQMLVRLMTRGGDTGVRRQADVFLQQLGKVSSEAREFMEQWKKVEKRMADRWQEAENGRLTKDPEALALASRFYDSDLMVNFSTAAGGLANFRWETRILAQEPMTDLECAQACVYAPSMSSEGRGVCRAYVLLDNRKCMLMTYVPKPQFLYSSHGSGQIRVYPVPAAVQFCLSAQGGNTTATVDSCQAFLTQQYSSTGAQKITQLRNPIVLKHVCRAECQSLVRAVHHKGSTWTEQSTGVKESWCAMDVVQLVQAHELQCCGDACGWDPISKSCAGIHLLSKVTQEEWFAECCSPFAVMQGSDRDHMCQSSSKVIWQTVVSPKRELQESSVKAFQWGEDASPNFGETATTRAAPNSDVTQVRPTTTTITQTTTTVRTAPTTSVGPAVQKSNNKALPPQTAACRNTLVGPSAANTKMVPLPHHWLTCGAAPMNKQQPTPRATFAVDVSGSVLRVRRTDAPQGWQFPLELSCCASSQALVELGVSRVWPRPSDMFQSSPCELKCADPTFMKSALLQCSASTSREWVAPAQGVQTCSQASFIKSENTQSPAACAQLGTSIKATHASWRYLPGDRNEETPHQGLCSLYRSCGRQDQIMFTSPKAAMSNVTEVLWSRLARTR